MEGELKLLAGLVLCAEPEAVWRKDAAPKPWRAAQFRLKSPSRKDPAAFGGDVKLFVSLSNSGF